jgi:hypothetical protein
MLQPAADSAQPLLLSKHPVVLAWLKRVQTITRARGLDLGETAPAFTAVPQNWITAIDAHLAG